MAKKFYAMVITSHADDAEYGVAGTVVKWVRDGKKVVYVVCTNGKTDRTRRASTSRPSG